MIQFFVTPIGLVVELIEALDFQHDFKPGNGDSDDVGEPG